MLDFYKDKRVFITGHTGFKGSWLCRMLIGAGAKVYGYALDPAKGPNLFLNADVSNRMSSVTGDIRDREHLFKAFSESCPEIVIHLAAQPIVRASYKNPVETYEVNVMGTVNICEAIRQFPGVKSFLNVTTDKVYRNVESERGYVEDDELGGFDPYSNSKSCSEFVTQSYINSFFNQTDVAVSTARAGNVIGGGDFAEDRIIPDCVRAASSGRDIIVRNPDSVRMYQHVLEPLSAYLLILQKQFEDKRYSGFYNVGPEEKDAVTTGNLADLFCEKWNANNCSPKVKWVNMSEEKPPHEAALLKLDCTKLKKVFGWSPRWSIDEAVSKTVEWSKLYFAKENIPDCMDRQIKEYFESGNH